MLKNLKQNKKQKKEMLLQQFKKELAPKFKVKKLEKNRQVQLSKLMTISKNSKQLMNVQYVITP